MSLTLGWTGRGQELKIVYVTMGSMQKLTKCQLQALYHGLSSIPDCAVAWSLKEDQQALLPDGGVEKLPRKFFVHKWLPQAEALQLSDVAVVITHCGWGGLNETIAAGKAIVATPFRADQPTNANIAKSRGFAEVLDTSALTAEDVHRTVRLVLADPSYAERAKKMQATLLKTEGAEACVNAVERLVYKGFDEVVARSPGMVESLLPLAKPWLYAGLGAALAVMMPRTSRTILSVCRHAASMLFVNPLQRLSIS